MTEEVDLFSFGNNDLGQLGLGSTVHYNSPQKVDLGDIYIEFIQCGGFHVVALCKNKDIYSWGLNQHKFGTISEGHTKPFKYDGWPQNIVDIKCGDFHTVVLTIEQEVYSWGQDFLGQIGRTMINHGA